MDKVEIFKDMFVRPLPEETQDSEINFHEENLLTPSELSHVLHYNQIHRFPSPD